MRRFGPLLLAAVLVGGCAAAASPAVGSSPAPPTAGSEQPTAAVAPSPTVGSGSTVAIDIAVPGPATLPADLTPALTVLRTRLTSLGVAVPASGLSIDDSGIRFTGIRPPDLSEAVVRAALSDRGAVTIVGLSGGAEGSDQALPSSGALLDPSTVTPLADLTNSGATATTTTDASGSRALELTLSQSDAKAVADFTQGHVGGAMAVLIDGRVFTTPIIQSPITGASLVLVGGQDGDVRLIDALLASGMLPAPFGQ